MIRYALPVLYAVLVWWLSTGLILYLVGKPRSTYATTMATATLGLLLALLGLHISSTDTSLWGAYLAFTSALAVWAWHEVSFLTGWVTGPRTIPLGRDANGREPRGLPRFLAASATLIHHEIAIALSIPVIAVIVWDGPNRVGFYAFLVLWIARLSTKLNVYLGVPNLTEHFLPAHLGYLKSYFRHRAMNGLFPITVSMATLATFKLGEAAVASPTSAGAAGASLVAALAALAVLEHWFLVLPLPSAQLWEWGMRSRESEMRSVGGLDEPTTRATDRTTDAASRKALGAPA